MIDHVNIGVSDLAASRAFLRAGARAARAYVPVIERPDMVGFGKDGKPDFWISDRPSSGPLHVAFASGSRDRRRVPPGGARRGRTPERAARPAAPVPPHVLRGVRARPGCQQRRGGDAHARGRRARPDARSPLARASGPVGCSARGVAQEEELERERMQRSRAARQPEREEPSPMAQLASDVGNQAFASTLGRSPLAREAEQGAGILADGTVHADVQSAINSTRGGGTTSTRASRPLVRLARRPVRRPRPHRRHAPTRSTARSRRARSRPAPTCTSPRASTTPARPPATS